MAPHPEQVVRFNRSQPNVIRAGIVLAALTLVGMALQSCGVDQPGARLAGSGSPGSRGVLNLTIKWPVVTATSRLIPQAANSIVVTVKQNGQVVATTRPAITRSQTTYQFASVPAGTVRLEAAAYSSSDGSGTPVASGYVDNVTVQANASNQAPALVMASTISSIAISPASPSVAVGASTALSAAATDNSGSVVLVAPGVLRWSSSNTSVATVDGSGNVTGVAAGSATITVTDSESHKSGAATLTVGGSVGGGGTGGAYPANGQVPGNIRDLGTLPGGSRSMATGINNNGQVVGVSRHADGTSNQAFLWDSVHGMQDLGTLPGAISSVATGINNNGQVVGRSSSLTANSEIGGGDHAFLWDSVHGMQDLGTLPGGNWSVASGINNNGQVVGSSNGSTGNHAFLWDSVHGMQDLGALPGGSNSGANGINNNGQVVGLADSADGNYHAFMWDGAHGMQDLGALPGGSNSAATGVNDNGQVVGSSLNVDGNHHAFLWDSVHGMQDLGILPGESWSAATGINNNGQVVGWSSNPNVSSHAFLWDSVHGMQDLGTLPGGSGSQATSINNNGQVVGVSPNSADGYFHAFLFTPAVSRSTGAGPQGLSRGRGR